MRVGWLQDRSETVGGAELTAKSFRESAPKGIEIVDCPPGEIQDADAYVVHNCTTYPASTSDSLRGKYVAKYLHDVYPHGSPSFREDLLSKATLIFCSPLHREKFPHPFKHEGFVIPPPCDLSAQPTQSIRPKDAVWLGHALNPGKGIGNAVSWANRTQTHLDFIGEGPLMPREEGFVSVKPGVPFEQVSETLQTYKQFVFLPTKLEPFGRGVVEAWAAGCDLVVNNLIGARHYIENDRKALETAAEDFWNVVAGS